MHANSRGVQLNCALVSVAGIEGGLQGRLCRRGYQKSELSIPVHISFEHGGWLGRRGIVLVLSAPQVRVRFPWRGTRRYRGLAEGRYFLQVKHPMKAVRLGPHGLPNDISDAKGDG